MRRISASMFGRQLLASSAAKTMFFRTFARGARDTGGGEGDKPEGSTGLPRMGLGGSKSGVARSPVSGSGLLCTGFCPVRVGPGGVELLGRLLDEGGKPDCGISSGFARATVGGKWTGVARVFATGSGVSPLAPEGEGFPSFWWGQLERRLLGVRLEWRSHGASIGELKRIECMMGARVGFLCTARHCAQAVLQRRTRLQAKPCVARLCLPR